MRPTLVIPGDVWARGDAWRVTAVRDSEVWAVRADRLNDEIVLLNLRSPNVDPTWQLVTSEDEDEVPL